MPLQSTAGHPYGHAMPFSSQQAIDPHKYMKKAVKLLVKVIQVCAWFITCACLRAELPAVNEGASNGVSDTAACKN